MNRTRNQRSIKKMKKNQRNRKEIVKKTTLIREINTARNSSRREIMSKIKKRRIQKGLRLSN